MGKTILVNSVRKGLGRTTVSSILALELSNLGKKVLVIDNNYTYCDLNTFLMADSDYCIDDIKPYLDSNSLTIAILKNFTTKVANNLELLSGSKLRAVDSTLEAKDIEKIKNISEKAYDFIIIDNKTKPQFNVLEIVDIHMLVVIQNQHNKTYYDDFVNKLTNEEREMMKEIKKKSLVIINQYEDEIKYDVSPLKKIVTEGQILKINRSPNLIDFCNGYKYHLNEVNTKNVKKIIGRIAEEKGNKKGLKSKFKNLKLRNLFSL